MARISSLIFQSPPTRKVFLHLRRQPARHFELAVVPSARGCHRAIGDVGSQNTDVISVEISQQVFDHDPNRVSLLAGGAGSAPDADRKWVVIAPLCFLPESTLKASLDFAVRYREAIRVAVSAWRQCMLSRKKRNEFRPSALAR